MLERKGGGHTRVGLLLVVLTASLSLNFVLVTIHVSSRYRTSIPDDGGSLRGFLE